ncbi:hypothetical protein FB451DRAFT_1214187 [Mycena latifolia]|nr:hypothetical protein FB451DRAFT_1214187 [Mycena latifolia]
MEASAADSQPVILSVPTEILLEIISYYHNTPIPYERHRRAAASDSEILYGQFEVLRAFSQTCHRLRSNHLEALPAPLERTGLHILLLKKHMAGILKTPPWSPVSPAVSGSLAISPGFLQATPNLSALHIIDISDRHAGVLSDRLETLSFPAVTTLTNPSSLARALRAFPNLRTLICAESFVSDYGAKALLTAARTACPALEGLTNFMPSPTVTKFIAWSFPRLQTLRFRHQVHSDVLAFLSPLHHLQCLEFAYQHQRRGEPLERVCDAARTVLRASGEREHASILVHQSEPEADIGDVFVKVELAQG